MVIPVESTVVPVVGQAGKASKITKTKTVLKGIEELSESKADDLVEKLLVKGEDNGITKIKLKTIIDDKIKILPKETLYGTQAETFLNSEYRIAEAIEDIYTYRRFGGDAKLGGAYVSTSSNLTREELALVKEFNNSMRFEAVIKIPKGEKLAVGKVGP